MEIIKTVAPDATLWAVGRLLRVGGSILSHKESYFELSFSIPAIADGFHSMPRERVFLVIHLSALCRERKRLLSVVERGVVFTSSLFSLWGFTFGLLEGDQLQWWCQSPLKRVDRSQKNETAASIEPKYSGVFLDRQY